jgi:hypothetical protein
MPKVQRMMSLKVDLRIPEKVDFGAGLIYREADGELNETR